MSKTANIFAEDLEGVFVSSFLFSSVFSQELLETTTQTCLET